MLDKITNLFIGKLIYLVPLISTLTRCFKQQHNYYLEIYMEHHQCSDIFTDYLSFYFIHTNYLMQLSINL